MRILDLGCGWGLDLADWGVSSADEVTGIDIDEKRLAVARTRFPNRSYLRAAGEQLPFENEIFDRVIASVAVPYMDIPRTLAQIYRTLAPGGSISLSLHLPRFTLAELHLAIPHPIPTAFRLYVLANGVFFHCTGRTLKFITGKTESFQTERGMRFALRHAGFVDVSFHRAQGRVGQAFFVEARKPGVPRTMAQPEMN